MVSRSLCYDNRGTVHSGKGVTMHLKTEVREFHVSTILPMFGGLWETCVFSPTSSYVVEYYSTQAEAREGHEKIVAEIENNPNYKLPSY